MKRVGIVGCGGIAGTHVWVLLQLSDVEITAFADIKIDRAIAFSKEYTDGRAAAFSSIEEMITTTSVDVVHICTPHYLHVPMAIYALRKGICVFCEKPPAINMEQFEELRKEVEQSEARLGFCFQNRYNQTVKEAKSILAEGTIGAVIGVRAFVTWKREADYYETDWKGQLSTEGGGALINQSIHTLDLMLQFLGEPEEVIATVANHHLQGIIEVEDTVEAWMRFKNGKRGCFYASTGYVSDAPVIIELTCERGSITMIDKTLTVRKQGFEPINIEIEEVKGMGKSYWGNGHLTCINDYYEKMESGERFSNDLAGVENTMRTMMIIYDFRKGGN